VIVRSKQPGFFICQPRRQLEGPTLCSAATRLGALGLQRDLLVVDKVARVALEQPVHHVARKQVEGVAHVRAALGGRLKIVPAVRLGEGTRLLVGDCAALGWQIGLRADQEDVGLGLGLGGELIHPVAVEALERFARAHVKDEHDAVGLTEEGRRERREPVNEKQGWGARL